ncbi:MAG: DUF1127 domain-containing protein [Alphaproteobacteria bacterium]|nr:DUF1127 domain-containing protein [Alphaproteobacteria bacterium]
MTLSNSARRDAFVTPALKAWTTDVVRALAALWCLWRQRRVERRQLAAMDARSLRELGISPELADYELNRPFWQPMRDLRR